MPFLFSFTLGFKIVQDLAGFGVERLTCSKIIHPPPRSTNVTYRYFRYLQSLLSTADHLIQEQIVRAKRLEPDSHVPVGLRDQHYTR